MDITERMSSLSLNSGGLTDDQQKAYDIFTQKKSMLVCGGGGNGKSFLIRKLVDNCINSYIDYVVCSTTGTSAVNINGRTLHSVFGLKPDTKDYEGHATKIMSETKMKMIHAKLKRVRVIILDEVSMLDDVLCEGISTILKIIKFSNQPFGGVQMVFVGDLFQLPPVANKYCFLSKSWNELKPSVVELKTVVRQAGDTLFQNILHEVRYGEVSDETYKLLEELKNTKFPDHIVPTKLYPVNVAVDNINNLELEKLKALGNQSVMYKPTFTNIVPKAQESMCKDYTVDLCIGAQVMVIRNINLDANLVNGSRGVVKNLSNKSATIQTLDGSIHTISYAKDELDNKKSVSFLPLKLAYAITIHKSQGATLDAIEIDLGKDIFQCGQAYTGLSRAKTMKNIRITNLCKGVWKTDPLVLEWLRINKLK